MTRIEAADMLERYATQVVCLPGVSRTNPHAFAEAKSELAGEMRRQAKEFRTLPILPAATGPATIRPGVRTIGRRDVRVEVRRRTA